MLGGCRSCSHAASYINVLLVWKETWWPPWHLPGRGLGIYRQPFSVSKVVSKDLNLGSAKSVDTNASRYHQSQREIDSFSLR